MRLSEARSQPEQFQTTACQCTFRTPLKDLPHFVATITSTFQLDHAEPPLRWLSLSQKTS